MKTRETKLDLEYPIKRDGVECSSLTLRRPAVKDWTAVSHIKNEDEKMLTLICMLSDTKRPDIDEMDMADLLFVKEQLESFLARSR